MGVVCADSGLCSQPPEIPNFKLLRLIGKGSYGEVWLGRGLTGTYRAVKVIHRKTFSDARPFDREFSGIKNFEPISQSSDRHLSIFHVGKDEERGFFFYIMELADDSSGNGTKPVEPESYTPKTLQSEIRRLGRIPVKECVRLGLALTRALELLHQHQLTHRDIKPSNIIFSGGTPKFSDVGLVAPADESHSFVGTKGFIPPEGPGSPQADIFSLGKVLYEASSGRPCDEFPELPANFRELADRKELIEFNEVVLKACSPDPQHRYRSAQDCYDDLLLLSAGKSVKKKHRTAAQVRWAVRISAFGCIVLAAAVTLNMAWRRWAPAGLQRVNASTRQPEVPSESTNGFSVITKFNLAGVWDWRGIRLGRARNLAMPVLFMAHEGRLLYLSSTGQFFDAWVPSVDKPEAFTLQSIVDCDSDGNNETLVSWRKGKNLSLALLNQNKFPLKVFTAEGNSQTGPFGEEGLSSFGDVKLIQTKGPSKTLVVATVGTGITGEPRGLYCFDYATQKLLWEKQIAAYPTSVEALDIDGDGQPELILGSDAVDNGIEASDRTDDSHAYIHVFTLEGKLLWKKELGGVYSRTFPIVVRAGASKPTGVYAWLRWGHEVREEASKPERGLIVKFNPAGEIMAQHSTDVQFVSCQSLDLDRDGTSEILVLNRKGTLEVLDTDLRLRRTVQVVTNAYDGIYGTIAGAADLDGDNMPELILTSSQVERISGSNSGDPSRARTIRLYHDNRVIILDTALRSVGTFLVAESWYEWRAFPVHIADFTGRGRSEMLVATDDAMLLRFDRAPVGLPHGR